MRIESRRKILANLAVALICIRRRRRKNIENKTLDITKSRMTRRWWVRPTWQLRDAHGMETTLTKQMEEHDADMFFQTYRMSKEQFQFILDLVSSKLKKEDTFMREAISAKARLAVTIRYLASGDSMFSLSLLFHISPSTVSLIIREVCVGIWEVLQPLYMKPPTREDFKLVAHEFKELWQFPNCIGAIDGKHCRIQAPPNSGSDYYGFHGFFSVILLGICDARYKFMYIDVGAKGRENDSGIFSRSAFGSALYQGRLPIPNPVELPDTSEKFPCVFVGDEAFPLKENLMRPYGRARSLSLEQKIFNYRLSRARRVIENAFGILSARFRILRGSMLCKVQTADKIIKACTVLHNYLITTNAENGNRYLTPTSVDRELSGRIIPGSWRDAGDVLSPGNLSGNFAGSVPTAIRERYSVYFNGVGAVPWQGEAIANGNF